jgi:hypothetical protein
LDWAWTGRLERRNRCGIVRGRGVGGWVRPTTGPCPAAGKATCHRQGLQVSSGHLGRADQPLHPAAAPARATPTWPGTRCGKRSPPGPPTGPHHHLGPGQPKWPTARASPSLPASRPASASAQALAARLEREHQRAAASEGSGGCSPRRGRQDQSTAADPGGDVARATGPRPGRTAGRRNTGTPGCSGPGRIRTKSLTG